MTTEAYNGKRSLYVVLGPPAAGKTAWINAFKEQYGASLQILTHKFDDQFGTKGNRVWHDFANKLHSWSEDPIPAPIYHVYRCAYWAAYAPHLMCLGELRNDDVVLMEPPLPMLNEEVDMVRALARSQRFEIVCVWCNANLVTRIERNKRRGNKIPESVVEMVGPSEHAIRRLDPDRVIWNNQQGAYFD